MLFCGGCLPRVRCRLCVLYCFLFVQCAMVGVTAFCMWLLRRPTLMTDFANRTAHLTTKPPSVNLRTVAARPHSATSPSSAPSSSSRITQPDASSFHTGRTTPAPLPSVKRTPSLDLYDAIVKTPNNKSFSTWTTTWDRRTMTPSKNLTTQRATRPSLSNLRYR